VSKGTADGARITFGHPPQTTSRHLDLAKMSAKVFGDTGSRILCETFERPGGRCHRRELVVGEAAPNRLVCFQSALDAGSRFLRDGSTRGTLLRPGHTGHAHGRQNCDG